MITDTSFITECWHAEKIDNYKDLMDYMKQFKKETWERMNIMIEKHHITPAFECKDLDQEEEIWLPVGIHFRAHLLRARDYVSESMNMEPYIDYAIGNYTEAFCILRPHKRLQNIFYKEFTEAEECYEKFFKPATYEAAFGKRKATLIKRKIAKAMSNLDPIIIAKRNKSISKYAKTRPESHNQAISRGKMKTVIHINTGKCYKNAGAAAIITGISLTSIKQCCQGKIKSVKNQQFEYML